MKTAMREAFQWFDRIHSRECTPSQRAEFLEWLYEDPRHGEAFATVEKTRAGAEPPAPAKRRQSKFAVN